MIVWLIENTSRGNSLLLDFEVGNNVERLIVSGFVDIVFKESSIFTDGEESVHRFALFIKSMTEGD